MADGKVSFAYSRFLGLDKDKETGNIVVNPEQAETVRLIFHLFLEGMTPHSIAAELTSRGIKTPAGKDVWNQQAVRRMISNEKYKGDALLQKEFTVDFLQKTLYPQISFDIVLAYMPEKVEDYNSVEPMDTLYPREFEAVPRKIAISWRNNWMLTQSGIVICYVKHTMGGSGKFVEEAERQGKPVINLYHMREKHTWQAMHGGTHSCKNETGSCRTQEPFHACWCDCPKPH